MNCMPGTFCTPVSERSLTAATTASFEASLRVCNRAQAKLGLDFQTGAAVNICSCPQSSLGHEMGSEHGPRLGLNVSS